MFRSDRFSLLLLMFGVVSLYLTNSIEHSRFGCSLISSSLTVKFCICYTEFHVYVLRCRRTPINRQYDARFIWLRRKKSREKKLMLWIYSQRIKWLTTSKNK